MVDAPLRPVQLIKGRGASSQITHRFARELRQDFDDGWDESDEDEEAIPAGVSLAPQIPFLNDDMEQVLAAACAAGARQAFYAVLRLPWEVAPLFEEWLSLHYPDRALRVMERVRDLHGISEAARAEGKVYTASLDSA